MSDFHYINPFAQNSYEGIVRAWLNKKIRLYSKNNWLLSRSYLTYLISKRARNYLSDYKGSPQKTTLESIFGFPNDWNSKDRYDFNINQYKKYIRMINYIADKMGIKTAHFIQPAPAIDKELTEHEKSVVGDLSYRDVYLSMTKDMLRLRDERIPIYSLLDVFKETKETVYGDTVHCQRKLNIYANQSGRILLKGESLGYFLMANRIAPIIGRCPRSS